MKSNFTKAAAAAAVLGLALMPVLSFAQYQQAPEDPGIIARGPQDLLRIVDRVIGWIFTFLLVLAVIFVLYAAFLYLTAAGDAEKVGRANHIILYAAVAIAVAVLSRSIPYVVKTFVGGL